MNHIVKCSRCGCETIAKKRTYNKLCQECLRQSNNEKSRKYKEENAEIIKERNHAKYLKTRESDPRYAWHVVNDPDEEYGFRPGAKFAAFEIGRMLSFRALTPGTVLETNGEKYLVRGGRIVGDRGYYKIGVSQGLRFVRKGENG